MEWQMNVEIKLYISCYNYYHKYSVLKTFTAEIILHPWISTHVTTYISQTSKRRKLSIAERKLPNLRSMLPWLDFVYKRGRCRAISGPLRFFLHFFFGRLCFYTTDTTTQAQEAHKVSCSFLSTFRVAEVTISPRTKIRSSNVYKAIGPLFFSPYFASLSAILISFQDVPLD